MKKIYTTLVALAVVGTAVAQNAAVSTATKVKASNNGVVALEQPSTPPSVAAAGDTINGLYYDFSTPTNWTFGNTSSDGADWVIGTTGATGSFSSSYGQIESTTAANGWAVFDSDGLGSASSTHDAWVQLANSVDLTGFASVAVSFQQYNVRFQNNNTLEVSTDGTTWTEYDVNTTTPENDASANPENVVVNISGAVAANPSTVWIRFRFVGTWDYAWHVDDVAFVEGASNDIQMTTLYHGDIINAFEYQQIPLEQAQEVVIGAIATNGGGATQNNTTFTFDISDGSGSVASGSFAANDAALVAADMDTTWYPTGFTPSATGDYTVTVSVSSDETDELPGNNELMSVFTVSESIYTHDDEPNIEFQVTGTDANGDVAEFKIGTYYEIFADATMYAVQVAFGGLTSASTVIAEVYDATDLSSPLASEVYDLQSGDVPTGGEVNLVNILLEDGDGLDLIAGNTYLVVIGNTGAGEELYVLASDGDDDRGQLRYGPFGAGGAVDWYTGYTTSPVVRANFDNTVGVEENEHVSGVYMYPNPATDNLTVGFVSKDGEDLTVNVVGVDGALVASQQLVTKAGQSNTVRFDVKDLAAGMYMVQIQGVKSSLTQKVIVQ